MPAPAQPAYNRIKGRKRHSFQVRLHPGLLRDLTAEARKEGRSINTEIVRRLEASLVHRVG